MSNIRAVLTRQIKEFINYRHSSDNIFFCVQSKRALLKTIAESFLRLSSEDKKYIIEYCADLFETGLTPEQKIVIDYLSKNLLKNVAIGATGGWIMGSLIGPMIAKKIYIGSLMKLAGWGMGIRQGVWLGAAVRYPNVDINNIKHKINKIDILFKLFESKMENNNSLYSEASKENHFVRKSRM